MISEFYIYINFFENFNINIGFCDIKQILFTNYQNWSPKKLKSKAQFKISYKFECEWKRALNETSQVRVHLIGFERPSWCELENPLNL